jgi:hypothetical protein
VSCVERGRWAYRSRHFSSSGSHSPSKLRYALKRSVSGSAQAGRGHRSDQAEVWQHVDACLSSLDVASSTSAMSEAYDTLHERTADYRESVRYVAGATGVAVAIGKDIVALDVFDKPATCERVWDRLLSGCVLEALAAEREAGNVDVGDVERLLNSASHASWQQVPAVGEGDEFRAEFDADHASVLSLENTIVHGSVLAAG